MNYSLFETEKNNPLQDHDTDGQYNALATETCTFASPNGNSSSDSGDIDAAVNTISNGLHTNQSPVQFAGAIDTVQSSLGNRATMHLAGEQLQQNIHGIAQTGFRDAAGSYPFQEQIQQSFGAKHDISSLSAHTGPAARSANAEFGSDAYHQGGNVAFAGEPTLHDAAHEAAHYVQNVGTTQLAGGVGTPNDCYEQHADKVADGVAQGQDVSGLLDQIPGATQAQAPVGGAEAPVQMAGEGVVSRLGKLGRRSIMSNLGMGSMGMSTSAGGPFQRTRSSRPWVRPSMDLGDKGTYPFKMPDEEQKVKNHSRYLDRRPGVYDMVPYSGGKQVSTIPPRQFPQGNRQFFQNHDDIMFFLDMLQNRVGQNQSSYHPFMDICDYPYGWWEAVMAHSTPEVLEENLARIQHQQDYKGIQAQPGFADFYRHLTINQHGQQCDFVHQSVSVSMGDKTLHNHLIPDFRQLVEKDELGNPILDKKGKPKRRDIIPKPTTGMYGLNPESGYAIGPPGGVGDSDFPFMNSIIEPYTGGPTKYSGSDPELAQYLGDTIQGSNPGIEKWPPLVRFSGIPLSNPLDALIYYELSRNARTGIYDVRDKACPQFSLGMLNMGGANMGEILPSSSGGDISASDPGKNVSSLNPGITRELDNYLAHNTTHHFDPTLLASLRDQNASVTDKEGNQLPLNFPNQLPISPFDLYVDFTKPWLLPKDAPWPWHGEIYQKYYEEWLRNQT